MTMAFVWGTALALYLVFRLWYDGWRGPLTAEETNFFYAVLEKRKHAGDLDQDIAVVRQFMEEDDGKEFVMVNMIKFHPSPLCHPDTGKPVEARNLLGEYFKPLAKMLIKQAAHPVLTARVAGGYIEAWHNTDPNWDAAGLIRYRSRRDAMTVFLASSKFDDIHRYKAAAIEQTFASPVKVINSLYASPRITVALVLALVAALVQATIT